MQTYPTYRKHIVTSVCGLLMAILASIPVIAGDLATKNQLDGWFAQLADPAYPDWKRAEADIERAWSQSGSAALDLLLQRGNAAIEAGDYPAAIDHLTALTEQAPDFAEGWNARATAYYLMGQYGPSIADIGHVLTLEPRHFGAISGLGMILRDTGHKAAARDAFRKSLAINPHQDGIRQALDELERDLSGTEL